MYNKIIVTTFAFFAMCMAAFSQANTTASISGFVKDTEGQALEKATIKVEHLPSGTKNATSAGSTGKFNILGLKVGGPYRIVVTMVGYESKSIEDVFLSINQTFTANFHLRSQDVMADPIIVEGMKNDIISSDKTGATYKISNVDIDNLPTIARSIHDYSRLSPLIVSSSSNGSNVAGRNMRYNNITIDGAVINDAFGLASSGGTFGGTAGTQPISLDAIEQFQVSVSPFDIKEGGFTGGLINAISKSGNNTFNGSVYYFGRNKNFVGKNPVTNAVYPDFNEAQIGARVGGPIIKNKLFYFANFEMGTRNDPYVVGLLGSNEANIFSISADSLRIIRDAVKNKFGYDPGNYDDYTKKVNNYKLFVKFDYNISDNHRLSLRHNFVTANQGGAMSRTRFAYSFSNQEYLFNSLQNQTVMQLNSIFSSNLVNELKVSYTSVRENRDLQSDPFPSVTLTNMGKDGKGIISFGVERFSQANALDQDLLEFTDNLSYFLGNHVITLGTSNQMVSSNNTFLQDYFGTWEFSPDANGSSLDNLLAGKASRYQLTYANTAATGGELKPKAAMKYFQWGVYAQDDWSVAENFKLIAGFRVDLFSFTQNPLENTAFATPHNWYGMAANSQLSTSTIPNPVSYSPRVGFNWDINNDKTYQLRGGIGLFSGRTPGVWISNQFSNTGVDVYRIDERNTKYAFSADVNNQPRPDNPKAQTSEINLTDKELKMPQLLRANIGFDYQLPLGMVLTLEALYGKTISDIEYQNINLQYEKNADGSIATAIDGRNLYSKTLVDKAYTRVIYMKNTDQGSQLNLVAQLQKPYGQGFLPNLSANIAYTFSKADEVNALTSSRAVSNWQYRVGLDPNRSELGRSSFEIPHKIMANVSYTFDYSKNFATTIGVYYEGRSGLPFSMVYVEDANGDNIYANDLVYIPTGEDDPKFNLTTKNWAELNALINDFDYLKNNRGKIMERNSLREPWRNSVDLRLTQDIKFFGYKLQVTLDAINFLNLLNNDWGRVKYVPYNSYYLFTFKDYDKETGKINAGYTPKKGANSDDIFSVDDLGSRWQLQLGLRFSF